ncbi:2182_t:CDS:1, partial [Gigaspora margarita]
EDFRYCFDDYTNEIVESSETSNETFSATTITPSIQTMHSFTISLKNQKK